MYFAAFLQNYISVSVTLDLTSSFNPSYEHFASITDYFFQKLVVRSSVKIS